MSKHALCNCLAIVWRHHQTKTAFGQLLASKNDGSKVMGMITAECNKTAPFQDTAVISHLPVLCQSWLLLRAAQSGKQQGQGAMPLSGWELLEPAVCLCASTGPF